MYSAYSSGAYVAKTISASAAPARSARLGHGRGFDSTRVTAFFSREGGLREDFAGCFIVPPSPIAGRGPLIAIER